MFDNSGSFSLKISPKSVCILAAGLFMILCGQGFWADKAVDGEVEEMPRMIPQALAGFVQDYENRVLPIGTVVRIEGEFETYSIPKGADPDAEAQVHHSGNYVSVFTVGVPDRLMFKCSDFSVPTDKGGGERKLSYYDIEVFCDGTQWVEVKHGSQYLGSAYRPERDVTLRSIDQNSWYVLDAATGKGIFPLNTDFGGTLLIEKSDIELQGLELLTSDAGHRLSLQTDSILFNIEMNLDLGVLVSEYGYELSGVWKGWRTLNSDFRPITVEEGHDISLPMRSDFYRLTDGNSRLTGTNTIHAIRILSDREQSGIYNFTIPHGWEVNDTINEREYVQGKSRMIQWLKQTIF